MFITHRYDLPIVIVWYLLMAGLFDVFDLYGLVHQFSNLYICNYICISRY